MDIGSQDFLQKYKDHYHIDMNVSGNICVMDIIITSKLFSDVTNDIINSKNKLLKLNGFRKGSNISKKVIKDKFNKNEMYDMAFTILANSIAVNKLDRKILHIRKCDITYKYNDSCSIHMEIILEQIIDIDVSKLDMSFTLPDLSIDSYVNFMLQKSAALNPILKIKNDSAEIGDMVRLNIRSYLNNKKFLDGSGDGIDIRLIKESVKPPQLFDKLLGVNVGDDISLTILNPDLPAFSNAFIHKNNSFRMDVKVIGIFSCHKADINDDLAITMGYNSLDNLKSVLIDTAHNIADNRKNNAKIELVSDFIVNNIPCDEPDKEWIDAKIKDTNESIDDILYVYKFNTILSNIGRILNIEWADKDKNINMRDYVRYTGDVLAKLVDMATFND